MEYEIILSGNDWYYLILVILILLYISYRIAKRKAGSDKVGCIGFAYVSAVYLSLCIVSIPTLVIAGSDIFKRIIYDSYDAVIVDVSSYMSEDSNGDDILMYSPIVKFTPRGSSEPIIGKLGTSSSAPFHIGDSHAVSYSSAAGKIGSSTFGSI